MSQISLKPLDDGQIAVEIPLGKTTIGRGPLLGCSDKKVSRNHAVLEVTAKREVFLTPTHVNPCFYQPTADNPGQILKKDVPHKLENGDSFSLLPRAYRYQLIVQGDAKSPDINDANKATDKTNGSTGEEPEDLVSDRKKDSGDEKPDEEEDAMENAEKNHKDEDKSSMKVPDTDRKSTSDDNDEKDTVKPKENNISSEAKSDGSVSEKGDNLKVEKKVSDKVNEQARHAESAKSDDQAPSSSKDEKETSSNEKSKSVDSSPSKEDSPEDEATDEKKVEDTRQSLEDETLDTVASKESNDADKTTVVTDWAEEEAPAPAKAGGKKRGPKKGSVKRKASTSDALPKPKGRKKKKFDFSALDDSSTSQRQAPGRTSSRTNRQTRQGLSLEDFVVSDDDEWGSDGDRPKKRRRKRKSKKDDSESDWETDRKKPKKGALKGVSGSESGGSDWGNSPKKGKKGPKGKKRKGKQDESSEADPDVSTSNAASVKNTRIPCTYGKKCYRRNQNHTDQFSHPGDSDYTSEVEVKQKNDAISESEGEEVVSPTKKECPYGANCFRKNAQHKKDFKHTKKVRPQRDAAKHDKKGKGSSDEIDSYDLDESLRDDSADEYKPADSGSDYETKKPKRPAKGKGAAGKTKRGRRA